MITNNICLAITDIAVAGILAGPISTANARLSNIYSDKPLRVADDAVPFIEDYGTI